MKRKSPRKVKHDPKAELLAKYNDILDARAKTKSKRKARQLERAAEEALDAIADLQ